MAYAEHPVRRVLNDNERLPQSTAYRYLDEVIEVLAARAPGLQEQLERALAEGAPT